VILGESFIREVYSLSVMAIQAINRDFEEFIGSSEVESAGCARAGTFRDVVADRGGGDVGMAEKVLDGADVGSRFEEMAGE
jgi:hypothetical protein